jgi:hypothetical protein
MKKILALIILLSTFSSFSQSYTISKNPDGSYSRVSDTNPLDSQTITRNPDGTYSIVDDRNPMISSTMRRLPGGSFQIIDDLNPMKSSTMNYMSDGTFNIVDDFNPLKSSTLTTNPDGSATLTNDFDPFDTIDYSVNPDGSVQESRTNIGINPLPNQSNNYGVPPVKLPSYSNDGGAYQNPKIYAPDPNAFSNAFQNSFNQAYNMVRAMRSRGSSGRTVNYTPVGKREGNRGVGFGVTFNGGVGANVEGFFNTISLGFRYTSIPENEDDYGDGIPDPADEMYGTLGVKILKPIYLKVGFGSRSYIEDFRNDDPWLPMNYKEAENVSLYGIQGFFKAGGVAFAPEIYVTSVNGVGFGFNLVF